MRLRGRPGRYGFDVRSFDLNGVVATADFAPVYPASEEVTPKKLREVVGAALVHARDLPDPLPAGETAGSPPLRADALWALHRPRFEAEAEEGRRRLAFDELLVLQLGLLRRRPRPEEAVAPALEAPGGLIERYRRALPFELTPDQEHSIEEIDADLARSARCSGSCRGTSDRGRPSSRSTRCCARSKGGIAAP